MNWLEKDKELIWHPFTSLLGGAAPIFIESAKGPYLYTSDGRAILDAVSSWWVNIHGHSHPYIAAAIAEQAGQLEHVIFAGFTHQPAIRLAENLMKILPPNQKKVFFSDNGSTSVEVALKMAFQYWYNQGIDKKKTIALNGAYHGDTFGAMSVGERSPFSSPFNPYLFDVEFIDFPTGENDSEVLDQFKSLVSYGQVGAFIFEPLLQGAGGMRVYSKDILDSMISFAQDNDVICIADEVMTGFGRTGKLFATDHLENNPDIMCLSKGLTGGTMALGITSCSQKIVSAYESEDTLKTFFHGHSFTANPIACATANASFELLMKAECQEAIKRISDQQKKAASRFNSFKTVKKTRNLGTLLAVELNTGDGTSYFNEVRKRIYPYFLEKDILLRPLGNVIYVLPPFVIQNNELEKVYSSIEQFLKEL
ncbi:Adenosylmethionine-8-amino-7-oxononanoate aminotransferase [Fulvivirga imtechensis AK7]|uniref:Adenosylmethionine-8-amino-7-oxononanoate aminotransferase n=1 Tax=Fulvivirga imtechensis AK7 TaxID=1237149 RepID=L8K238_9BACT|nr:adenosylmethionine--8-amino-7-oxononanoate transaminase [Fulvivirga imtechensis]ELR73522.1 Adenosylmethionine-8-amino-7-oxononanoate aminotransferase [Fulvivirga imtechensis AK7]